MIRISVIIPVYNCDPYIKQCLESVLSQAITETEIICIDDGSWDLSAKIIRNMAQRDSRILLFQQNNQGAGAARNFGISRAQGKYIAFLDADDYYQDRDALKKMYELCEKEHLNTCGSMWWSANGELMKTEPLLSSKTESLLIDYLDYQMDYGFTCYLFLREFLVKNRLGFPCYQRFEDPPFLVKALYEAGKIGFVDTCLYYYRMPEGNSRFDTQKAVDLLKGLFDNLQFAKEHHLEILFQNTAHRLEYECMNFICDNAPVDEENILKLLLYANQIINGKMRKKNYLIRPLRLILRRKLYQDRLLKRIQKQDRIALYGAGRMGQIFLCFLQKKGLFEKVKNVIVSEMNGEQKELEGIPIIPFKEFCQGKGAFLFVTVGKKYQKEIEKYLNQQEYRDYEVVEENFLWFFEKHRGWDK